MGFLAMVTTPMRAGGTLVIVAKAAVFRQQLLMGRATSVARQVICATIQRSLLTFWQTAPYSFHPILETDTAMESQTMATIRRHAIGTAATVAETLV